MALAKLCRRAAIPIPGRATGSELRPVNRLIQLLWAWRPKDSLSCCGFEEQNRELRLKMQVARARVLLNFCDKLIAYAGLTGAPFLRFPVNNWVLHLLLQGRILDVVAKAMKKSARKRSLTMFDRPIVYRGIKIPPHTRPAFCHGSSHPRRILGAVRATAWQTSARLSR